MKKLITKKDLILLFVVLLAGVVGIIIMNSADEGKRAEIIVDGKTTEIISLDEAYEKQINGVVICCEKGEIYIKESNCPDKVCMRSGRISKSGESIICAPNRVAVKINGKKGNLPDAITG